MGCVVPQGPWTGPVNWNLCATHCGEILIPFGVSVQPTHDPSPSTFVLFRRLPTELQFHILGFCDRATLFQCMHVCAAIRNEAQKLFWSTPLTLWYNVSGTWLFSGGFSGHTYDAVEALRHMKQVEIDFEGYDPLGNSVWEDGVETHVMHRSEADKERQIQAFWDVLQRRLPCVTHVVLSETFVLPNESPLLAGLKRVAESCPRGISAFVSILQEEAGHERRLSRSLWRPLYSDNSTTAVADWEIVMPTWSRQSILPPPKDFRGPVGAYCYVKYHAKRTDYLHQAYRLLLLQAVEAYYLQNLHMLPFICPREGCGLRFALPGQWTIHAIDTEHDMGMELPSEELVKLLVQQNARLEQRRRENKDMWTNMRATQGRQGTLQRARVEYTFLNQLQCDPSFDLEKPLHQSSMWRHYQRDMHHES